MTTMQRLGIDAMTADERLALVQDIWDSLAPDVEAAPLTPAQRQELERRLADCIARPDAGTPWEEVKAQALRRARG